jgi:hypothetical protein
MFVTRAYNENVMKEISVELHQSLAADPNFRAAEALGHFESFAIEVPLVESPGHYVATIRCNGCGANLKLRKDKQNRGHWILDSSVGFNVNTALKESCWGRRKRWKLMTDALTHALETESGLF